MMKVELTCDRCKKGAYICWVKTLDAIPRACEIDRFMRDHAHPEPDVAGRDL